MPTYIMDKQISIQEQHQQLVATSFKHIDGRGGKMELLHAILGLAGEVGELVDAVKKHVFYEKPLDIENVIEEMGDIEYYMEALRQTFQTSYPMLFRRDTILAANLNKLRKRYPGETFSNEAAVARADRAHTEETFHPLSQQSLRAMTNESAGIRDWNARQDMIEKGDM